jgi:hypothetical protein
MAIDLSKSGWENLDNHKPTEARPMFGPDGVTPVTAPPVADDLTPAERAMFAALESGGPVSAGAAVVLGDGPTFTPLPDHLERLAAIRKVAADALESNRTAHWAAALDKIQEIAS